MACMKSSLTIVHKNQGARRMGDSKAKGLRPLRNRLLRLSSMSSTVGASGSCRAMALPARSPSKSVARPAEHCKKDTCVPWNSTAMHLTLRSTMTSRRESALSKRDETGPISRPSGHQEAAPPMASALHLQVVCVHAQEPADPKGLCSRYR